MPHAHSKLSISVKRNMQVFSDSGEDAAQKRRHNYRCSHSNAFHSRTTEQYSFDPQVELQNLAEFQERTRYRLIANRRSSLNFSSSFDEPVHIAILNRNFNSHQSSFRRRKYAASTAQSSLKAISFLILFLNFII